MEIYNNILHKCCKNLRKFSDEHIPSLQKSTITLNTFINIQFSDFYFLKIQNRYGKGMGMDHWSIHPSKPPQRQTQLRTPPLTTV